MFPEWRIMYKAFLIKYAEIAVKGKNRYLFEDALVSQMRHALKKADGDICSIRKGERAESMQTAGRANTILMELWRHLQHRVRYRRHLPGCTDWRTTALMTLAGDCYYAISTRHTRTSILRSRSMRSRARKNYPIGVDGDQHAQMGERIIRRVP